MLGGAEVPPNFWYFYGVQHTTANGMQSKLAPPKLKKLVYGHVVSVNFATINNYGYISQGVT